MVLRTGALCCMCVGALQHGEHEVVAHLKQRNLEAFERTFWDIANPDHPNYLHFLSSEDVASVIGATDDDISAARAWLVGLGAEASSIRVSALRDTVTATVTGTSEHVLKSSSLQELSLTRPSAVEFLMRRDARDTPAGTDDGPRAPSAAGYGISGIKKAYGIPEDLQASNEATTQMVWGPGTFGYSPTALQAWKTAMCPLINTEKVKFDTENHGRVGDNFIEGNLDVTMITSFGLNVETVVSNTNTSASTEEGTGFGQALLDFATELATRETLPHVLSMSLGSLSAASCDKLCEEAEKLGHSQDECGSFLQKQRQVCMFLSQDQTDRINTAFQVLGARGVSVFAASGDGGSHFSFKKFSSLTKLGRDLNTISCEFQMPVAPTGSPYITAVGGEDWKSGQSSHPVTWKGSGGGITWQFERPDHQRSTVASYLNGTGMPPASSYNPSGSGYPDMAALGVQGTSQACPIAAGIFSMIIDHRLNAGLPALGHLAPRMWQVAERFPGEAFFDITEGNSQGSCDNGFPATEGWDANTGWGRPIWDGMLKHFGSDDATQGRVVATVV